MTRFTVLMRRMKIFLARPYTGVYAAHHTHRLTPYNGGKLKVHVIY
jgi:hypothetical protein